MNIYLQNFLYFLGGFIFIFLIHLFLIKHMKRKDRSSDGIGINLIIKRFNLDLKKIKYKKIAISVSLVNSFIISFTSIIILNIDNFIYKLIVGFVLITLLIYALYEIIGRSLYKSQFKLKVKKTKIKKEKT